MANDFQRVVAAGIAWARQVDAEEKVVCTYGVVTAFPSDWIIMQTIAGESNTYVMSDFDFADDWVSPATAVRENGTSASGTDPHPKPETQAPPVDPDPPVETQASATDPESAPAADPEPAPPADPEPAPPADPEPAPPADPVNPAPAAAVPVPDAGKHESPEDAAALVDATTPADPTLPAKVKEVPTPTV